jgi:predicted nucleotidyltransferase
MTTNPTTDVDPRASVPPEQPKVLRVPWLDVRTAGLLRATVATIAETHSQLVAAILFGSVARHDERPLTDCAPSDVDLLLLFNLGPAQVRIPEALSRSVYQAIGRALDAYLYPPREVKTVLAAYDLADWDPAFVENVARDGLLLWLRGPLPDALAPVMTRELPES